MYKLILAALVAFGIIIIPTESVSAKPANHSEQKIKRHKHRKKRHPVIVEDKMNAFLKDCGIFGCGSNTYTSFRAPMNGEVSAGEYWAREYERNELSKKKTVTAKAPFPPIKKEKECTGFFTVCDRDSGPYMEAKKWEGKSAKENRQELKTFLAQGNNNVPVDPAKIPWCAAFANAILNRQGYETTGSLAARSFLSWGAKTKDPKEGDIVVLKRGRGNYTGHVGFFQGYEIVYGVKYVKVFGGNTDHAVQAGYYPSGKVLGYRKAV
jgi:uncharacterized protein (TIGR02594 family)